VTTSVAQSMNGVTRFGSDDVAVFDAAMTLGMTENN
jgi:hypothetical protein